MHIRTRVPRIRLDYQPSQHMKRVIALATAMFFSMPLIAQYHKAGVNQYGNNAAGPEALCPSNYTWAGDTRDKNGNILHHCAKNVTPMQVPSARNGGYEEVRGTNYPTSGVSNTADGSDLCVQQMMDLFKQMSGRLANDDSDAAVAQAETLEAQMQAKGQQCEQLLNQEQANHANAVTGAEGLASGNGSISEETSAPSTPSPGSVAALDDSTNDLLTPMPKAIAASPIASTQDGGNNANAGEAANNPAQDAKEQTDEAAPATSAISQDPSSPSTSEETSAPSTPSPGSVAALDDSTDELTPAAKAIAASPIASTQEGGNDASAGEAANNPAQDAQEQTGNEAAPTTSAITQDPSRGSTIEDTSAPPTPSSGSVAALDGSTNDFASAPKPTAASPIAATQDLGNEAEAANNPVRDAQGQTGNEAAPTTAVTTQDPSSRPSIGSQSQDASNAVVDVSVAASKEGANESTPPTSPQADSSSTVADLIAKRDRIDQAIADITDMQMRSAVYSEGGISDAHGGMVLGGLQMLKGASDSFVNTVGEWIGPEGKVIKSLYGLGTDPNLINSVGGPSSNPSAGETGINGAEAAGTGLKIVSSGGEIMSSVGEKAANDPSWAKLLPADPEDLESVGGSLKLFGVPEKLLDAYNAAGKPGEWQPVLVDAKAGSALAIATEFAADKVGNAAVKEFAVGEGQILGTAEGAIEGLRTFAQGASTFADNFGQIGTIQNQQRNFMYQSNNQLQHLQALRDSLNQQIMQATQQSTTNGDSNVSASGENAPISPPNSGPTPIVPQP